MAEISWELRRVLKCKTEEGSRMIKRCFFIMLILAAFAGIMVFFAFGRQKVNCVTGKFNVIVPEDGKYRITVNAKHASGYVEVYLEEE